MAKTVGIGLQSFETIRKEHCFYVDKTPFIKEWWESKDSVTLITRPRRFGKTLTMSMAEQFFSTKYAGRGELFQGLSIWKDEAYRELQGTYPVISLSFATVKEKDYGSTVRRINQILTDLYYDYHFLIESDSLLAEEKVYYSSISEDMPETTATIALQRLSRYLYRYYKRKVIILLDEYDTPMQEAYVNGFWEELVSFTRSMFNAAFKTNPYLERAIMTGITRVSRESIFSDLNNLKVVTSTSNEYADCFGFTEKEVFRALDEFEMSEKKQEIKKWYDGFTFGNKHDIYNPWSILNYLDTGKIGIYWANSSSNRLVDKLIKEGSPEIKMVMEELLQGGTFHTSLDEQIVFSQLDQGDEAVWSLLLASGYLKAVHSELNLEHMEMEYDLKLTNLEVQFMFLQMIRGWFGGCRRVKNAFLQAMFSDDLEAMNEYMNEVSGELFSSFDTGKKPSQKAQPERLHAVEATTKGLTEPNPSVCFYHGFVLGLMAEARLQERYVISSNRESGLGRYDIMLEPKRAEDPAFIIEFKVVHTGRKETLEDGVRSALQQIEEKQYETVLISKGIPPEQIRKYGFAFAGQQVLIGQHILSSK